MTRQDAQRCNRLIAAPAQTDMTATTVCAPAYDALAPAYDLLTAAYRYDRWLAAIERLARGPGPRGRRGLDASTASAAAASSTCPAARATASWRCWGAATTSPRATSRRRWSPAPPRRPG